MNAMHKSLLFKRLFTVRSCRFLAIVAMLFAQDTFAQFSITETFKGSEIGSSKIVIGGQAVLTGNGTIDTAGDGWLRLTQDNQSRGIGWAYIDEAFTTDLGVYVDFEYTAWRTVSTHHGAGDGLSVFLFDGSVTGSQFRIGPDGGALGYAQAYKRGKEFPGLKSGYLGIGVDEYGNFAMENEGKVGGVKPKRWKKTEPSIAARGSEKSKYKFYGHKALRKGDIVHDKVVSKRPSETEFYRRVKIYIVPKGIGSDSKYEIRILWRKSPDGADEELIKFETKEDIPRTLKVGFAAAIAGAKNNHEIRNLTVTSIGGLRVQNKVNKANASPGDELEYRVEISNDNDVTVRDIPFTNETFYVDGHTPADANHFEITSVTFDNGGNSGNTAVGFTHNQPKREGISRPFKASVTLEALSNATFIIKGKVKRSPLKQILVNKASIEVPSGVRDTDSTNDVSSVQTYVKRNNFWHGTKNNDWRDVENWIAEKVPSEGEDIEFATAENNPGPEGSNYGPAKNDLHLDWGEGLMGKRVIGNLINDSDRDLVITTRNQLTMKGKVIDNNPDHGNIVVKASADLPSGTLIFEKPDENRAVVAKVEFYNQAYKCADCGLYKQSWQYFGIPVQSGIFPYNDVDGNERINEWREPENGNKWRPTTATDQLEAFKGYQITNDTPTKPTALYTFSGTLNVGDKEIELTQTPDVNYSGVHLIANSYTAAISIKEGIILPSEVEKTIYLFHTGTRDQWRKRSGHAGNQKGYKSGQYLAVPQNLAGNGTFPKIIPSMQTFMVLPAKGGSAWQKASVTLKYDKLTKNELVDRGVGQSPVALRSAEENIVSDTPNSLPSLTIDMVGVASSDQVYLFQKAGTTQGYDDGWDGRKMGESHLAQLYVVGVDDSKLQVSTSSTLDNLSLAFIPDADGDYTLTFAPSKELKKETIYLYDQVTGAKVKVENGGSYTFRAKVGDAPNRFRLSATRASMGTNVDDIKITTKEDGTILIVNSSGYNCSAFISDLNGKMIKREEVPANTEYKVRGLSSGLYIIRLENGYFNAVRKLRLTTK